MIYTKPDRNQSKITVCNVNTTTKMDPRNHNEVNYIIKDVASGKEFL